MSTITLNKVNNIKPLQSFDKVKVKFYTENEEEIIVEVKKYLTLPEISQIVDNTVNNCFTNQGYAPEYKDVMFFKNFIEVATNLPMPMINSGNTDEHNKPIKIVDIATLHKWLFQLDFFNVITCKYEDENLDNEYTGDHIIPELYMLIKKLNTMIDEKLGFQKALLVHPDRDNDIVNAVVGFFDKLNSVVANLEKNFGNIDMEKALPVIGDMAKNIAEGKVLSRENIQTILEVGSASKVGSENVPNLEVVK